MRPPTRSERRLPLPRWLRLKCLDRYILTRYLGIYLGDLIVFCLIYVCVDSLGKMDDFAKASSGVFGFFAAGLRYYFYELPGLYCQLLGPITSMASAMFAVTLTQRANELVPVLATGTSVQRLFAPIVVATVAISGLSFAIQELWIPAHRHEIRAARAIGANDDEIRHPVFIDHRNKVKVAAVRFYPYSQSAEGLVVYSERFLIQARAARWTEAPRGGGDWLLEGAVVQRWSETGRLIVERPPAWSGSARATERTTGDRSRLDGPLEGSGREQATSLRERFSSVYLRDLCEGMLATRPPAFTPADLEIEGSQAAFATLGELRRKAEVAVENRNHWRMKYYGRLVDPLQHIILVLLGVPIILWHGSRNIFLSAVIAVVLSATYFVLQSMFLSFEDYDFLRPWLAAWICPIFFASLGLTLYREMRS